MPDIVKELQKRMEVPIVSSFNNPDITTLVFGYHAVINQDYFLNRLPIVILTNYDLPQINTHVCRQLVTLAKLVYSFEFTPFLPKVDREDVRKTPKTRPCYTEDQ